MTKLLKINDQLMGLTLSELTQVQNMIHEIKSMKAKAALSVGDQVLVGNTKYVCSPYGWEIV